MHEINLNGSLQTGIIGSWKLLIILGAFWFFHFAFISSLFVIVVPKSQVRAFSEYCENFNEMSLTTLSQSYDESETGGEERPGSALYHAYQATPLQSKDRRGPPRQASPYMRKSSYKSPALNGKDNVSSIKTCIVKFCFVIISSCKHSFIIHKMFIVSKSYILDTINLNHYGS